MIEVITFAVIHIAIFSCMALYHITTRLDKLIDLLSESEETDADSD